MSEQEMSYAEEVLDGIGIEVRHGSNGYKLYDDDGALFGAGLTIRAAVLDAANHFPRLADKHGAALYLAAALDKDADAVVAAVTALIEGAEEGEDVEEDVEDDDDVESESEDEGEDEDGDEDEDEDEDEPERVRIRRE